MTLERDVRLCPLTCPLDQYRAVWRGCVTDDATGGPIVPGTVLGLLGIQALTRTATIELSYVT